jgi:hypothetical protein
LALFLLPFQTVDGRLDFRWEKVMDEISMIFDKSAPIKVAGIPHLLCAYLLYLA